MTEAEQTAGRTPLLERLRQVDLAQTISKDGALWNGTQAAEVEVEQLDIQHRIPGAEICFTRLSIVSHNGTHVDAARHFFPEGRTIDEYDLDRFVLPAVAIDARREGMVELTAAELAEAGPEIRAGDAVLIYFGYAERFGSSDYGIHPHLSTDAARYIVERGATLVGVDTLTPDLAAAGRPAGGYDLPVHNLLLGNDVLIIENLGPKLRDLLGERFLLVAVPLRIAGGDAAPVVPVALVEGEGVRLP